jgi:hypothetical protein
LPGNGLGQVFDSHEKNILARAMRESPERDIPNQSGDTMTLRKSIRIITLALAGLLSAGFAQASPYLLNGTFGTTTYPGPLNGGTFSGTYEFNGPSSVNLNLTSFDIVLRDAGNNVLGEITQADGYGNFFANYDNNGAYDVFQFATTTGPLDFLSLVFNIGFDGIGDVQPFPILASDVSSFAGVDGNTFDSDSVVASGTSVAAVPEPGTLALVTLAVAALAGSHRRLRGRKAS